MKTCKHASCGEVCKYPPREKKYARIGRIAEKRKEEYKQYWPARDAYMQAHPYCEVTGCLRRADELHHRKGRCNKDLYNSDFFMSICRVHHARIKSDPKWAMENGYTISRLAKVNNMQKELLPWQSDYVQKNHSMYTAAQIAVKMHCTVALVVRFCLERKISIKGGKKYSADRPPRKIVRARVEKEIIRVPEEKFVRPPAVYDNKSPYGIATSMHQEMDLG